MVRFVLLLVTLSLVLAGCGAPAATEGRTGTQADHETLIADLGPANLEEGTRLRVVATTSIIADTVTRVAGDAVALTVLLKPGADPHSYTATPQDMAALSDADIIFANGLNLEESLLPTLEAVERTPIVSVNEGVALIESTNEAAGEEDHEEHGQYDPHTWQAVPTVAQWAANIAAALSTLYPAHAAEYRANAAAYGDELAALDEEVRAALAEIPEERRKLVTDHDTFAYFARDYGFSVIGSVVPSFSSLASISAQELAGLQEQIEREGAPAVFVGATVNPRLAEQVAADMEVPVVLLYSDALGAAGTPGDSYVGMMRANSAAIAAALQ